MLELAVGFTCSAKTRASLPVPVSSVELAVASDVTIDAWRGIPDDRWETNDVAKLCPEVVESLSAKAMLAGENSLNPASPTNAS
jgi:hypothetical protein